MSIMTVTSRITHRSLMNKSKSELASMYLELCDVNGKLNASIMNQCGDNLCWLEPGEQKIPPAAEFLESCRRYHAQISGERGELKGCSTIAQLESEVATLKIKLATATETWDDGETVWAVPTAWAYAQACKVINGRQMSAEKRAEEAERKLAESIK